MVVNGGVDFLLLDGGDIVFWFDESICQVGQVGCVIVDLVKYMLCLLWCLVLVDFVLVCSVFGWVLVWSGVVIVFGVLVWLLLVGMLIVLMQYWGLFWFQLLLIILIFSLVVIGYVIWCVLFFFCYIGMYVICCQLLWLGLYDEFIDDDFDVYVGRVEGIL